MNKTELINEVAALTSPKLTKQDCTNVINATLDTLTDSLTVGNDIAIAGFGSFKVVAAGARTGRNPQTGESIEIPAKNKVTFKPAKHLKEVVQD